MSNLSFDSRALLAPMAGVNDPVFRLICKEMGAGLTYTEMISAKGLEHDNRRTKDMLFALPKEKPVAVQLFGRDANNMARQAVALEEQFGTEIALIDINMACPARKVAGKGEGAALMNEPELASAILIAVCAAVQLPVTVKIRKGYYASDDTAIDFAARAEQAGVKAVAVHGRTAQQLYRGHADRAVVGRVARAVTIPVIASGDVFSRNDVNEYLTEQGATAVMVARGAQGNPWIFAEQGSETTVSVSERLCVAEQHVSGLAHLMPRRLASMRKHVAWYLRAVPQATTIRRKLNECCCLEDYLALFSEIRAAQ